MVLIVSCSVRHLTPHVANHKQEKFCSALTYVDMVETAYRMNGYFGLVLSGQPLTDVGYTCSGEMRTGFIYVGLPVINTNALTRLRKNEAGELTYSMDGMRCFVKLIVHKDNKRDIKRAILENFGPNGHNYPLVGFITMGRLRDPIVARNAYDYRPYRHKGEVDKGEELHAVLIVGVDNTYEDKKMNFCLVKNSWGDEWGRGGFTKVASSVFEEVDIPVFSNPISRDIR